MYIAYAGYHRGWTNPALVFLCVFVAIFLPKYSILSNRVEQRVNLRFALVTLGRASRVALQLVMNLAIWTALTAGGVVPGGAIAGMGGVFGAALLTTFASVGGQFVAQALFNRGYGDLNRNVMAAISLNIALAASATIGVPALETLFKAASLGAGGLILAMGVLSDLRGGLAPRGGIGVFFGTFNPFHATHLAIIRAALAERGLDKVIVHPKITPKLHAQALDRGEIRIARVEGGLCVLEKTDRADANVNYFPTGDRFFAPETRRLIIALAIEEAGLAGKVEVMWRPEIYRDRGFHGIVGEIRRAHPGARLHGLHGSDLGGMWVRAIYDECGWIYPYAVRRTDGVSATAIRKGAAGMTGRAVAELLAHLKAGAARFESGGRSFRNEAGVVSET
jgi:hypothetical protein